MEDSRYHSHRQEQGEQVPENAISHPLKRPWRSPELTEVDYELTENGGSIFTPDAGYFS